MRILIDECINERLRNSLAGHDSQTARYAGFAGLKNGDLLTAAEAAKFDVFLTVDQGIEYQQNLTGRKIAIILRANSNRLHDLLQLVFNAAGKPSMRSIALETVSSSITIWPSSCPCVV
jgi:predicted nuclease of predicted toxin-antitoxin system